MDIRVNINGVEAVVTVQDVAEATSFLASLSNLKTHNGAPAISQSLSTPSTGRLDGGSLRPPAIAPAHDDVLVKKVLMNLRGNPSSRFLQKLTDTTSGSCTDKQIKDVLKLGDDDHLGPTKKVGIPLEAILTKQVKRGPDGKMHYKYRIAEQAARLVKGIEKFTEPVEIPEFEDDEDAD